MTLRAANERDDSDFIFEAYFAGFVRHLFLA